MKKREWVSEWVGFNDPPDTVYIISGMAFPGRMHTDSKFNLYNEETEYTKHKKYKLNLKM